MNSNLEFRDGSTQRWVRLADLSLGGTRNGLYKPKEFHGSGAKIVNMGELFAFPRLANEEMKRIEVTQDELDRFGLQAGDLLFARRSLVADGAGKCSIVVHCDAPTVFESSIIRLRPARERVEPEYLFYLFRSSVGDQLLDRIRKRDAVSGITGKDLAALEVPLPAKEVQRNVCDLLSTLDNRIDHNQALAANLEAIARRLFKSWFVDFDPVRAKAAGEKPSGLADDIATLFPDRFVGSELGEIPEGWRVGKISDFSTNVRVGCTPSQFSSEDFFVGLEHFDRRCLTLWNGGSGDAVTSNKSRFKKGDLLFGKLRPYFHKVAIAPIDGICSTDILVIRCADKAYQEFMYFSLFQDDVVQFISDASGGTRMPRTNWETLAGYDCVVPPKSLFSSFGEIVAPMIETMMQCVDENNTLTQLRDLLLPRLISGKIRVKDAESSMEETIA